MKNHDHALVKRGPIHIHSSPEGKSETGGSARDSSLFFHSLHCDRQGGGRGCSGKGGQQHRRHRSKVLQRPYPSDQFDEYSQGNEKMNRQSQENGQKELRKRQNGIDAGPQDNWSYKPEDAERRELDYQVCDHHHHLLNALPQFRLQLARDGQEVC